VTPAETRDLSLIYDIVKDTQDDVKDLATRLDAHVLETQSKIDNVKKVTDFIKYAGGIGTAVLVAAVSAGRL